MNLAAFIILMAVLEPLEVLRILPDDEIIGADGSLGAFGHGEPSCKSCRMMKSLDPMEVLELAPFIILMEVLQIKPLAGDAALADPDVDSLGDNAR